MTTREYFQNVLNAHISDEMDAASVALIQKMDAKNTKRKTTPTKEQVEAANRVDSVRNFFLTNPHEVSTRDDIATQLNITPAQVTAACKVLLTRGVITKSEAKVNKTRRVVYSLAE